MHVDQTSSIIRQFTQRNFVWTWSCPLISYWRNLSFLTSCKCHPHSWSLLDRGLKTTAGQLEKLSFQKFSKFVKSTTFHLTSRPIKAGFQFTKQEIYTKKVPASVMNQVIHVGLWPVSKELRTATFTCSNHCKSSPSMPEGSLMQTLNILILEVTPVLLKHFSESASAFVVHDHPPTTGRYCCSRFK